MLEIKVNGSIQTGKTQNLLELASMNAVVGKKVLFVCPTEEWASDLKKNRFRDDGCLQGSITFCGAHNFPRLVRSDRPQVIIFDELEMFSPHPEGDYIALARDRVQFHRFGILAYSTYSEPAKVKLFKEWMSKPRYKRVWAAMRGKLA